MSENKTDPSIPKLHPPNKSPIKHSIHPSKTQYKLVKGIIHSVEDVRCSPLRYKLLQQSNHHNGILSSQRERFYEAQNQRLYDENMMLKMAVNDMQQKYEKKNGKVQAGCTITFRNHNANGNKDSLVRMLTYIIRQNRHMLYTQQYVDIKNGTDMTPLDHKIHMAFEFTLPTETAYLCMDITIDDYLRIGDAVVGMVTHMAKLKLIGFNVQIKICKEAGQCVQIDMHNW